MNLTDRMAAAQSGAGGAGTTTASRPRPADRVAGLHRLVDPFAEIKQRVHASLLEVLGPTLYDARMDERELDARVRATLQQVLETAEVPLSGSERTRIASEVADEILGHGPLESLLRDPEVSEIMVNGPSQVYVERSGRLHEVDVAFADEAHLRRTIDKIVARIGRRVDEASPMVDARLTDGSRVNAVVPPIALDGSTLTIRKFAADPYGVEDLIALRHRSPARSPSCSPRACRPG